MYAAAGGASLASRQARQRQRQQNKTKQQQAKLHPSQKAHMAAEAAAAAAGISATPTRHHAAPTAGPHSKQFHHLPSSYLRTPQQPHGRKLSASYTAQSKLLLPIEEGDGQSVSHMHSHTRTHSHMHGPPPPATMYYDSRMVYSPKYVHRQSGSGVNYHHSHLQKSATATLPLVSQMSSTPPTTPLIAVGSGGGVGPHKVAAAAPPHSHDDDRAERMQMQAPHDSIIITPATPIPSPGHVIKPQPKIADQAATAAEKIPLTSATVFDDDDLSSSGAPPAGQLERKCSVYRMRRSDATTATAMSLRQQLQQQQQQQDHQQQQMQHFEPMYSDEMNLIFKGLSNGHKWTPCAYCEEGICLCDHIECAQGRAAWLERGRRCSVQDNNATACHRRWVKRNRIQDASLGGSSDDEDFLGVLRGPSTFANAFLYVGLGTIALGLVIAFVGTGEKGFKTVELRLIGPSLICLGSICCVLRILFCICPSHCISSSKRARKKNGNKVDADHTTSLLRGESKRVSIARGPASQQKYPVAAHKRSNSKMLNEGMEALRQIATTSLFMQNEQKSSMNRVVPMIKEPDNPIEAPLEMKKIETALNVCELSDDEDEDDENIVAALQRAKSAPPTTTSFKAVSRSIISSTTCRNVNEKQQQQLKRTSSKLSRERVSLNKQQQQQQHQLQQSDTKSPSPDLEDDGDLLMETSLMVVNPSKITTEQNAATSTTKTDAIVSASQALPPPPPLTTPSTSISIEGHQPILTSSSTTYDLPPSIPHTYSSRALASTPLFYSMPETMSRSSPLQLPTTLSACAAMRPLPTSVIPPATSSTSSSFTCTSIKTAASTQAKSNKNEECIPGQVMMDTVTSPPTSEATAPTRESGDDDTKTGTIMSLLLPTNQPTAKSSKATMLPGPSTSELQQKTQQQKASIASIAPNAISPTTTNKPSFFASSASSSVKSPLATTADMTPKSNISFPSGSNRIPGATAPLAPTVKFEPELLLSPAKLEEKLLPKTNLTNQPTAKSSKATMLPGPSTSELQQKTQQQKASIASIAPNAISPTTTNKPSFFACSASSSVKSPLATTAEMTPKSNISFPSGSNRIPGATAPLAPTVKFEPELLLSPAKLGQ